MGKASDWLLIMRDGAEFVCPGLIAELDKAYEELQAAILAKLTEVEDLAQTILQIYSEGLAAAKAIGQSPAEKVDLDLPESAKPVSDR